MKVAIDLDDVCLDFFGAITDAVNMEYGTQLTAADYKEWDLHKIIDPIIGKSWWNWWRSRDWLWARAQAVPGAIGGIQKLRDGGHYVELVTSKPRWAEAQTWQWLGKWRLPVQRVTITDDSITKASVTDADVLVDDKLQNVEEWAATGRHAILFTRPHNRRLKPESILVTRVFSWREIVEQIEAWSILGQQHTVGECYRQGRVPCLECERWQSGSPG